MRRWGPLLNLVCLMGGLVGCLAGCEGVPLEPSNVATVPIPPAQCRPNSDQDQSVYHPARLHLLQSCIHVAGVVARIETENDGDGHLLLRLDPPYQTLLRSTNRSQQGDLVVESVCVGLPLQPDALDACVGDAHPLRVLPAQGRHVWMEGRYVLDGEHGDWAELHPLYRWGDETAVGTAEGSDAREG